MIISRKSQAAKPLNQIRVPSLSGWTNSEFQALMQSTATGLWANYSGGCWDLHLLSNGGFYLAPCGSAGETLPVRTEGYQGAMSLDAFGLTATYVALCEISFRSGSEDHLNQYRDLLNFVAEHPEAAIIARAISLGAHEEESE